MKLFSSPVPHPIIIMRNLLTQHGSRRVCASLLALGMAAAAAAADFNSGSDGSYGPLNVTANTTLDLPADGVLHCTTVNVAANATLRFNRNPLNTPVMILAQGDVTIAGSVTVSGTDASGAIAGAGGPGGFDGGFGGFGPSGAANRGGDGQGPGRGLNADGQRLAVYANPVGSNNRVYGNVLVLPLIGGSGGAALNGNPGIAGGGGGGAILVASNTRIIVNGAINAQGGYSAYGGGSGGAIRLVAPTGGGGGNLRADGGGGGGNGRVRIDCTDPNAFRNLTVTGVPTRGTRMFALPQTSPKLHIVSVAGQAVPVNAATGVSIELPAGSPASQTVVVRGEGFAGEVPLQVVVLPEHSASSVFDATLNGSANPPEVSVAVSLPVGEPTRVQVWTKP